MIKDRNIANDAAIQLHKVLGPWHLDDVYWVAKANSRQWAWLDERVASDKLFTTIAGAISKANATINWSGSPWAPGITIYIAPGSYAENLTSLPYGSNLIGLGDAFDLNGERGVRIKPASGSPVSVTSCINSRIENICFYSPDTSGCFLVGNLNRNVIERCVFTGLPGASPSTVYGLRVYNSSSTNGDMTGTWIKNCVFQVLVNGLHIATYNAGSKQATGNFITDSYFRGCSATGIYFDANCNPTLTTIDRCVVGDGSTTLALGLDDNAGLVMVSNTNFECTACDPASADADSSYNNCYLNGGLMT